MKAVIPLLALYLTYYTFGYAQIVWRNGNKLGGIMTLLLAACFPCLYVLLRFL